MQFDAIRNFIWVLGKFLMTKLGISSRPVDFLPFKFLVSCMSSYKLKKLFVSDGLLNESEVEEVANMSVFSEIKALTVESTIGVISGFWHSGQGLK